MANIDVCYFSYRSSSPLMETCCTRFGKLISIGKPRIQRKKVPWQTTSGLMLNLTDTLSPIWPISDSRNPSRKHICHNGNYSRTPHCVCCHNGGKLLKAIGSVINNNPSRKYVCGFRMSHNQVGWSWFSSLRLFVSVVAHSQSWRFLVVPCVCMDWFFDVLGMTLNCIHIFIVTGSLLCDEAG